MFPFFFHKQILYINFLNLLKMTSHLYIKKLHTLNNSKICNFLDLKKSLEQYSNRNLSPEVFNRYYPKLKCMSTLKIDIQHTNKK